MHFKAHDCNSSYYKREGSSFLTSELGSFYDLYSPELTVASLGKKKNHYLASGFRAQFGVRKARITKFIVNIRTVNPQSPV